MNVASQALLTDEIWMIIAGQASLLLIKIYCIFSSFIFSSFPFFNLADLSEQFVLVCQIYPPLAARISWMALHLISWPGYHQWRVRMGQLGSYLIKSFTFFVLSHMEEVRQQEQVASIENDESRFLFHTYRCFSRHNQPFKLKELLFLFHCSLSLSCHELGISPHRVFYCFIKDYLLFYKTRENINWIVLSSFFG